MQENNYKMKVVERARKNLNSQLHRSDPWAGEDCGRIKYLLFKTKFRTGENQSQSCTNAILYIKHCWQTANFMGNWREESWWGHPLRSH